MHFFFLANRAQIEWAVGHMYNDNAEHHPAYFSPFPPHFLKALGISLGNPSLKRTAPLPSHCRIICRALWGPLPAVRVSATSFAAMSDARARAGWIVK